MTKELRGLPDRTYCVTYNGLIKEIKGFIDANSYQEAHSKAVKLFLPSYTNNVDRIVITKSIEVII